MAKKRDRSDARACPRHVIGAICLPRQALEGAALAPRNLATLRPLTDPARRPPVPREELSAEVARVEPEEPFQQDVEEFLLQQGQTWRSGQA